jgi:hypothetical protein
MGHPGVCATSRRMSQTRGTHSNPGPQLVGENVRQSWQKCGQAFVCPALRGERTRGEMRILAVSGKCHNANLSFARNGLSRDPPVARPARRGRRPMVGPPGPIRRPPGPAAVSSDFRRMTSARRGLDLLPARDPGDRPNSGKMTESFATLRRLIKYRVIGNSVDGIWRAFGPGRTLRDIMLDRKHGRK